MGKKIDSSLPNLILIKEVRAFNKSENHSFPRFTLFKFYGMFNIHFEPDFGTIYVLTSYIAQRKIKNPYFCFGKVLLCFFEFHTHGLYFCTGCSLSDQLILSPINPKHNKWFSQIYKDLNKFVLKITSSIHLHYLEIFRWCRWIELKHKFASFDFQNKFCKFL